MTVLRYLLPVVTFCFCAGSTVQRLAFTNPLLQDFTYNSSLLFEYTAWSKANCALKCAGTSGSVTFTFSRQDARCRCHCSALSSAKITSSPAPGTDVFEFQQAAGNWLYSPCVSHCECKMPGSECFSGKCLCTPGYYYSLSQNACVPTCQESDLQNSTFMGYFGFYRFANPDYFESFFVPTPIECKARCVEMPRCRISVSYPKNNTCYVYTVASDEHTTLEQVPIPISVSLIKSCV